MIELKNLNKTYSNGKISFQALKDINLKISQGEFVAIMGPSGSGKSTLMHILGFLDPPDSGEYHFNNFNVGTLSENQLCHIRRHFAGFVFQQFHLLSGSKAIDNVNLPQVYAGENKSKANALEKLASVGLRERAEHLPNELSGGERQRVAIARALINGPLILFADEPTGNLDTKSEEEIIKILEELNSQGMTIVMVTHEQEIAARAKRIVTMRDGQIVSDETRSDFIKQEQSSEQQTTIEGILSGVNKNISGAEFADHLKQAWDSIFSSKLRAVLSMLGITIGVAAVIAMLAVGDGATKSIEQDLASSIGSNMLTIRQGKSSQGGVSMGAAAFTRFTIKDSEAIRKLPQVKNVSGQVSGRVQSIFSNNNWNTTVFGVEPTYEQMRSYQPTSGRFFTEQEMKKREKVALIGQTVLTELFGTTDPIGKTVKLNKVNFKVIGVLPEKGFSRGRDSDDVMLIPLTTAMHRLLGDDYLKDLEAEIVDSDSIPAAKIAIKEALMRLHDYDPVKDVDKIDIRDRSEFLKAMTSTITTISLLLGVVAAIALVVGGIGIMNIMLVSVTERTREIGLRKAIGGSKKDIMTQFLVEAVVMTVTGGFIGILLGVIVSKLVTIIVGWTTIVSIFSITLSAGFSITIGIIFGLWPARQAANLNTIEALRYE